MGKVISKPKAPKVIKVPTPTPEPEPIVEDVKPISEAERADERSRNKAAQFAAITSGRGQTIKTSLRGVLSETNEFATTRRNLLGS